MSNSEIGNQGFSNGDSFQIGNILGSSNVAIGREAFIYSYNYNYVHETKRQLEKSIREPENYISRKAEEEQLSRLIRSVNGSIPILLSGISGAGKTWLVTKVLAQLLLEGQNLFPEGFLWASLANLDVQQLLQECLDLLEFATDHPQSNQSSARKLFWHHIMERQGRSLIIFDDVHHEQQLHQLLPDPRQALANCCILIICSPQVAYSIPDTYKHRVTLAGMKEDEIQELFCTYLQLSDKQKRLQQPYIEEIANRLGSLPLLLATAAHDMKFRNIPPGAYAHTLRELDHPGNHNRHSIIDKLELALHDLSPEQRDLFSFIGVLGEGPWRQDMLAAVAIRHPADIQADLDILVKRGLIQPCGDRRYKVNVITRELAQQLLKKQPLYIQHAAYVCLAHECLNYIRHTVTGLTSSPNMQSSIISTEASHIRQVIGWAIQHQEWQLLLQFADVARHEVLRAFVTSTFDEIKMNLTLASLVEPIVWQHGARGDNISQIFTGTKNWYYKAAKVSNEGTDQAQKSSSSPPPELGLNIELGQIIDGLFEDICLLYSRWSGVRATGLICLKLNLIGCELIACDLSQSIWLNIEAPQINLSGSIVSNSLLQHVRLYRATLKDANLSGAILKHVKLQGADLRNCNLTDALLDDVDLRGADLRGARVDRAIFHQVRFQDCRAEGVDWATAVIVDTTPTQEESDEIATSLGPEAQRLIVDKIPEHHRSKNYDKLLSISTSIYQSSQKPLSDLIFTRPDFRIFCYPDSVNPASPHSTASPDSPTSPDSQGDRIQEQHKQVKPLMVSKCQFIQADFRAANISAADFSETLLDYANFRRAFLEDVSFRNASMRTADLRAAVLKNGDLNNANLSHAQLSHITIDGGKLERATLRGAQLRNASLIGAQLQQAELVDADLSNAMLREAHLEEANLSRANLQRARLIGAHLSGANLEAAICDHADFSNAIISDEQLACAASWRGAVLRDGERALDIQDQKLLIELIQQQRNLRLAYLNGTFNEMELKSYDLLGVQLKGDFTLIHFQGAILNYAHLSGIFSNIDCTLTQLQNTILSGHFFDTCFNKAIITNSRLSGVFVNCTFAEANLDKTSFEGVSFVSCDFTGVHIDENMFSKAFRLRGCLLPSIGQYDGHFHLPGDIEDARKFGLNLDIQEQRTAFYEAKAIELY